MLICNTILSVSVHNLSACVFLSVCVLFIWRFVFGFRTVLFQFFSKQASNEFCFYFADSLRLSNVCSLSNQWKPQVPSKMSFRTSEYFSWKGPTMTIYSNCQSDQMPTQFAQEKASMCRHVTAVKRAEVSFFINSIYRTVLIKPKALWLTVNSFCKNRSRSSSF